MIAFHRSFAPVAALLLCLATALPASAANRFVSSRPYIVDGEQVTQPLPAEVPSGAVVLRVPASAFKQQGVFDLLPHELPVAREGAPYSFDFKTLLSVSGIPDYDATKVEWKILPPDPSGSVNLAFVSNGLSGGLLSGPSPVQPGGDGTVSYQIQATYPGGYSDTEIYELTILQDDGIVRCADPAFIGKSRSQVNGGVQEFVEYKGEQYLIVYNSDKASIPGWIEGGQKVCTSRMTNMSNLFENKSTFNESISYFDVINVVDFSYMFNGAGAFNNGEPSGQSNPFQWEINQSGVNVDMGRMFMDAASFNGDISQWKMTGVTKMRSMFNRASSFNQPIGAWDVSNVIDFAYMFQGASSFNQPLGAWNVGNVVDFNSMFREASNFNQPLGAWDMRNAVDLDSMFKGASSFNQPLDAWNLASAERLDYMFSSAFVFNNGLPSGQASVLGWQTPNLKQIESMFYRAYAFNANVNSFDVDQVKSFDHVFGYALSYDQSLDNWVTSSATLMTSVFSYALKFDQDINDWDVSKVVSMRNMFYFAQSFNRSLDRWNTSNVTDMGRMFQDAPRFNQSINNWNLSRLENAEFMFSSIYSAFGIFPMGVGLTPEGDLGDPGLVWGDGVVSVFNNGMPPGVTGPFVAMPALKTTRAMFQSAGSFNQDLSGLNMNQVTDMSYMFNSARVFNNSSPMTWSTANVTNVSAMFRGAHAFNQDLSGWCVDKLLAPPNPATIDFDKDTNPAVWTLPRPIWGTCPTPSP